MTLASEQERWLGRRITVRSPGSSPWVANVKTDPAESACAASRRWWRGDGGQPRTSVPRAQRIRSVPLLWAGARASGRNPSHVNGGDYRSMGGCSLVTHPSVIGRHEYEQVAPAASSGNSVLISPTPIPLAGMAARTFASLSLWCGCVVINRVWPRPAIGTDAGDVVREFADQLPPLNCGR